MPDAARAWIFLLVAGVAVGALSAFVTNAVMDMVIKQEAVPTIGERVTQLEEKQADDRNLLLVTVENTRKAHVRIDRMEANERLRNGGQARQGEELAANE